MILSKKMLVGFNFNKLISLAAHMRARAHTQNKKKLKFIGNSGLAQVQFIMLGSGLGKPVRLEVRFG